MHKGINLNGLHIGESYQPVFIAEIGINHNGSLDTAYLLAEQAINSGADVVKFQHHLPEHEMVKSHQWYELMEKCRLEIYHLSRLQEFVERAGKVFLCTPFCIEAAEELNNIDVVGFKTGSGEANHIDFLTHVAGYQKPMLISTGMSSRDELIKSLDAVRKINRQVVVLNCTSSYPCAIPEARLCRIGWLRSTFNLPVGQSDHTPTISTALGAVAMGAVCVEKHFTYDKRAEGPDHSGSLLPHEFSEMVKMGREIWEASRMCTEADMGVLESEREVKRIANHQLDEESGRVLRICV